MKKTKLARIIAITLIIVSIQGLNSIGASAEWKQDSKGWWYSEGSGWATGERVIDGHKYYFDKNGYMNTGWKKLGSNWNYFDDFGYMKRGWLQYGGKTHYLNPVGGYMVTDRAIDDWYFNSDGVGTKCLNIDGFIIDKSTGTLVNYKGNTDSLVIPREIGGIEIKRIITRAFDGCTNTKSITIPDSVTYISGGAFLNCNNLRSIIVNDNNSKYSSIDGALFNKSGTDLLRYPRGNENKNYTIPEYAQRIGDYAFENCSNLESITIPAKTVSFGKEAFTGCNSNIIFCVDAEGKKQLLIKAGIPESKIIINSKASVSSVDTTKSSSINQISGISNKSIEPLKDDGTFKAINILDDLKGLKDFNIKIRLSNIKPLGRYKLIEAFNGKQVVTGAEINANNLQSKVESQLFIGTFNNKAFAFTDSKYTKDNLEKDGTYVVKGGIFFTDANETEMIKESYGTYEFNGYIDCSKIGIDFAAKESRLMDVKEGKIVRVSKTIKDFRYNTYVGLQALYLTNITPTKLYMITDGKSLSKIYFISKEDLDKRSDKADAYQIFIGDFDGVHVAFINKNFSMSYLDNKNGAYIYGYVCKNSGIQNKDIPISKVFFTDYVKVVPYFLYNFQ